MKSSRLYASCFLLLCTVVSFSQTERIQLIEKSFISDTSLFKSCHASTIEKVNSHTLLSAWFGGSYEGSRDVCIWLSRNEGNGWQKPVKVADGKSKDGKTYACWNPVLFKARNGIIYLHYKVGTNPREWWAMYKISSDGGITWSAAKPLPAGFLGPVKNKPVQMTGNAILYPGSTESADEKHWAVHLEWSDASLSKWKTTEVDNDTFQTIQPTLLPHSKTDIQLLARSKQNVVVQSWSHDGGHTWSRIYASSLPNPNSGIDAAAINDSLFILVYNPLLSGNEWWQGRSVLKVAVSEDGNKWKDIYTLEDHKTGEYSYPAVIAKPSGNVYITYTYDRKKICYVHLKVKP